MKLIYIVLSAIFTCGQANLNNYFLENCDVKLSFSFDRQCLEPVFEVSDPICVPWHLEDCVFSSKPAASGTCTLLDCDVSKTVSIFVFIHLLH
jgi:hypothetical protein